MRRALGVWLRATTALVFAALVTSFGSVGPAVAQEDPPVSSERLTVSYQEGATLAPPPFIDGLDTSTLLRIEAVGFSPDTTGSVTQCARESKQSCQNLQPVRFDDQGNAHFQYLVTDSIDQEGRCSRAGQRCTIEIRSEEAVTVVDTIFHDTLPPQGEIEVSPNENLVIGDRVTVTASEFPADVELSLTVCVGPDDIPSHCGEPGPVEPMRTGSDGRAETEMILDVEEVGEDKVACGRREPCRLVVVSDDLGVRAAAVNLDLDDALEASYSQERLMAGVGIAFVLLMLALRFVRSTDWSPPLEADSSAIDDAEYADLDYEAELHPSNEEDYDL